MTMSKINARRAHHVATKLRRLGYELVPWHYGWTGRFVEWRVRPRGPGSLGVSKVLSVGDPPPARWAMMVANRLVKNAL